MATNIATVLNECLKEFTELTNSGALTRYNNEVSKHRWLDELGRLRIWAGNIGAHQTGQSSLDYRLRDASHLKNETVKLLQRLLRLLRDLADVIKDEDQVEDENENDELFFFEDSKLELEEYSGMTDIQMLFQSLRNTMNLLFQISMSIRRPADHDRLLGVKVKDESYFEPWAQQHISHKFPNATGSIISRLSAAMARQKAVLKYFERHRAKLSKGLSGDGDIRTQLSETVATEMVLPEDHLQFLETNSTSGISQTSYAPSIFTSNESLSVPTPPRESAEGNPFECPYCCLVIKIKGKKDWARHVFRDLMPYVCISAECSTPSKLYESRRQWYDHMCQCHSMMAGLQSGSNCPLCQVPLHPPATFGRHVGHHMEQLALFVLPRTIPSEEGSSETVSNVASLGAFGDSTTHSTDSSKGIPQMLDRVLGLSMEMPLEGPPASLGGLIEETPAGSGLNSASQAYEDVTWGSGEKTKKEDSHSFDLDDDMGYLEKHSTVISNESHDNEMPGNSPDSSQVDEFTRTTSHKSNHTNNSESGLSSHDEKNKGHDNTHFVQCEWKDCESIFPANSPLLPSFKAQDFGPGSFMCAVCGRASSGRTIWTNT
ncbi:Zinc finger, C2H2-type [Penicillium camemberti]|uniref:Zinc finger, C2H2-type n=1 Tax=Penicillium camemberti (strain FM 013) TaxID=1429867 RepID=A0A0G4P044_PENC3|nr:Zinc finger, C2H2-type [Penicillium camemberti]